MPVKKKHKFIVFEGIDGTGKSTLAKMLAKEIGGYYYHTPPEAILPIREYVESSNPKIRLQFYLLGNLIAEQELSAILKKQHVVCDRYVYSTRAYQGVAMGHEIEAQEVLKPDYVIYTKANWEKVQKRISEKTTHHPTEKIAFLKKVLKKYPKYLPKKNVTTIDTSKETEKESFARIMNAIKI